MKTTNMRKKIRQIDGEFLEKIGWKWITYFFEGKRQRKNIESYYNDMIQLNTIKNNL
jgi:hypothetical protein